MAEARARGSWLSEAALFTVVPALGYVIAFVYQVGFCSYFRLPLDLIRLEPVTVLISMAGTAIVAAFLVVPFDWVTVFTGTGREQASRETVVAIAAAGFLLAICFDARASGIGIFVAVMTAIVLVWIWAVPAIIPSDKRGYWAKVEGLHEATRKHYEGLTALQRALRFRHSWPTLAFVAGFLVCVAYVTGKSSAGARWEHYVVPGDPPLVALRFYGDNIIASPFDRKTWKLGSEIRVVKIEDGTKLRLENLGVLAPRK